MDRKGEHPMTTSPKVMARAREIRRLRAAGETPREIALAYGLTEHYVGEILRGAACIERKTPMRAVSAG